MTTTYRAPAARVLASGQFSLILLEHASLNESGLAEEGFTAANVVDDMFELMLKLRVLIVLVVE